LSNAEIADRLLSLAQLLAAQKENRFKIKAYRQAANTIRTLPESLAKRVGEGADLTGYAGIGKAISAAIREMVLSGKLAQLETLREQISPDVAALSEYPKLDVSRVLRIYKKLGIASISELRARLESGEIAATLGARMDEHVRQALVESHAVLLYEADQLTSQIRRFLLTECAVKRAAIVGEVRRRVEAVGEIAFLVEVEDFGSVVNKLKEYGGHTQQLSGTATGAMFQIASSVRLCVDLAKPNNWGNALILATGSESHLRKLPRSRRMYADEAAAYRAMGLSFIEPELREGTGEVSLAKAGALPVLVNTEDIRGDLHAHSTSSDGVDSIEQMARAAQQRGYAYTGITDHSKSLKIARGLSEAALREQIRVIDQLNARFKGFRILKSAEVDILADGTLDYPNDLLKDLDYTVCSIHSRFALGRNEQTERILRAMDNRYFTILGHASGRKILKRPGYEIDFERVAEHARKTKCFFEINANPSRLDLSAEHARIASDAGVKIAINTDAHSTREYGFINYGVDQARRAGLTKEIVLNTRTCAAFLKLAKR
jgi:DNA polymerase (family 10)